MNPLSREYACRTQNPMMSDYFMLPILFRSRARLDALCKFMIACFTFSGCPLVTALKKGIVKFGTNWSCIDELANLENSLTKVALASPGRLWVGTVSKAAGTHATICCGDSCVRDRMMLMTSGVASSGKCDSSPTRRRFNNEKPSESVTVLMAEAYKGKFGGCLVLALRDRQSC